MRILKWIIFCVCIDVLLGFLFHGKDISLFPLCWFFLFINFFYNQNALTDPQRVQTPSIMEYWKPLAEDVSLHILLQLASWFSLPVFNNISRLVVMNFPHNLMFSSYPSPLSHFTEYQNCFTFLKLQMDPSAGIEAEYHHKNNRVNPLINFFFLDEKEVLFKKNKESKNLRIWYPQKLQQ